jgi:hypothetical protein
LCVFYFIRIQLAESKGFDDILNLWQQRCAVDLETLDFGGIHGDCFYDSVGWVLLDMFSKTMFNFVGSILSTPHIDRGNFVCTYGIYFIDVYETWEKNRYIYII